MTKRRPGSASPLRDLDIRHWNLIRHSNFVIRHLSTTSTVGVGSSAFARYQLGCGVTLCVASIVGLSSGFAPGRKTPSVYAGAATSLPSKPTDQDFTVSGAFDAGTGVTPCGPT